MGAQKTVSRQSIFTHPKPMGTLSKQHGAACERRKVARLKFLATIDPPPQRLRETGGKKSHSAYRPHVGANQQAKIKARAAAA